MPAGFWWGLLAAPILVAAVCVAAIAVFGLIWASESWGVKDYKLWPKAWGQRESITSMVACARSVRYLWLPGWHIVICRTQVPSHDRNRGRHQRVQVAIATALRESEVPDADSH